MIEGLTNPFDNDICLVTMVEKSVKLPSSENSKAYLDSLQTSESVVDSEARLICRTRDMTVEDTRIRENTLLCRNFSNAVREHIIAKEVSFAREYDADDQDASAPFGSDEVIADFVDRAKNNAHDGRIVSVNRDMTHPSPNKCVRTVTLSVTTDENRYDSRALEALDSNSLHRSLSNSLRIS